MKTNSRKSARKSSRKTSHKSLRKRVEKLLKRRQEILNHYKKFERDLQRVEHSLYIATGLAPRELQHWGDLDDDKTVQPEIMDILDKHL